MAKRAGEGRKKAKAEEFRESIQPFDGWTRRVLRPEFIPDNFTQTIFGLKRWEDAKNDVLFSEYQVGDIHFRISDTPTTYIVIIESGQFFKQETNWDMFVTGECIRFLEGAKRLESYQSLHVTEIEGKKVFRINLVLPPPREDVRFSELWCQGNPTFWTDRKTVAIVVRKQVGVGDFPVDQDFGVGQRFPPLRTELKSASLAKLVGYLTEKRNPAERGVAVSLLCERNDACAAIPPLISAYKEAKDDGSRMDIIQTLEILTSKCQGESVMQLKKLVDTSRSKQNSLKLQSVLNRAFEKLQRDGQK